jgi:hypothetical protein
MRGGDLTFGSAKLEEAWETLQLRWQATKEPWNDSVSQQFEESYIAPLIPRVAATLGGIRLLAQILAKAEQECS